MSEPTKNEVNHNESISISKAALATAAVVAGGIVIGIGIGWAKIAVTLGILACPLLPQKPSPIISFRPAKRKRR